MDGRAESLVATDRHDDVQEEREPNGGDDRDSRPPTRRMLQLVGDRDDILMARVRKDKDGHRVEEGGEAPRVERGGLPARCWCWRCWRQRRCAGQPARVASEERRIVGVRVRVRVRVWRVRVQRGEEGGRARVEERRGVEGEEDDEDDNGSNARDRNHL